MSTYQTRRPWAFTLIELLIVVAIIAILAAIAVPNFLEAQTRAKVSRTKADFRSLATAIEAYYIDHSEYPVPANEDLVIEFRPYVTEPFETRLSNLITTPIAYITDWLSETFPEAEGNLDEVQAFHYTTRYYFIEFDLDNGGTGSDQELIDYIDALLYGGAPRGGMPSLRYFLLSHGPDLDHDEPDGGFPALYDPTNGTTSSGDILYFGPGTGFKN
jgi:prepilin-type N-terminal cleavage/methylation domain-containing protein